MGNYTVGSFCIGKHTFLFLRHQMLTSICQLAEAILSDDGEPDFEDASSILLDDTRSRRLSGLRTEGEDHETQFLVGNDEDEAEREGLEDEVQSFR